MDPRNNTLANIDWISILLWLVILSFGWMNIYSANIMEAEGGIFDLSQRFGKQIIWIGASIVLAILLLILDAKFYIYFSYILYIIMVVILMAVLLIRNRGERGKELVCDRRIPVSTIRICKTHDRAGPCKTSLHLTTSN